MGYEKQTWYDRPTGGTPINADRLNHIEEGIYQNAKNWDSISPKVLQDITSKFAVQSGWAFRPNQLAAVRIGDLIIVTGCFYRTGAQWNAGAWADSTLLKFPTELAPGGSQLDRNVPITTSVGNDDFCVGMVAKGEINVRTVDHSANFAQNWASSFTLSWVVGK